MRTEDGEPRPAPICSPDGGRVNRSTGPDLGFVGNRPGAYRGRRMVSLSSLELAPLAADMVRVEEELRASVDNDPTPSPGKTGGYGRGWSQ